ncbi:MAG: 16S rRNA (cytidine(1402)-2'-O)-methyltransferase, partial [Candidatus Dojkabacteria bacterium]
MSKLTLIGTPIGNLEDITIRSLKAIFSFDIILAEDTRNYIKLRNLLSERFPEIIKSLDLDLEHRPQLISYRDQNHKSVIEKITTLLETNFKIGFMSDAGMPSISDPGFKLVAAVIEKGFEVEVIPGPTAIDTAVVLSGLPTDRFSFFGFLPREAGKIKKLLNEQTGTFAYYESPFRVVKSLEVIEKFMPKAKVAAVNDLTKKFEKVVRGNILEVIAELKKGKVVGEWVI